MSKIFGWLYTAVVTPFDNNNSIDWKALELLVEKQIKWWVSWIVFAWTTWESPTLSHKEHIELLNRSVEMVNWRCQCIHWTWSNNTEEAIEYSHQAALAWADWIMVVNPYYNKPTQLWLQKHFELIANHVNLPMIVYNIFWRTWVNMETSTLLKLAEHPNIVAVKEASWDIDQMMDVIRKVPKDFSVLCWDDNLTFSLIWLWGDWVISVASNYIPWTMTKFVDECRNGDQKKARDMHYSLMDIFKAWFIETSPIPAKEIMGMLWYIEPKIRLPLCRASNDTKKALKTTVEEIKKLEGIS